MVSSSFSLVFGVITKCHVSWVVSQLGVPLDAVDVDAIVAVNPAAQKELLPLLDK